MDIITIAFYFFAILIIASGIVVVLSKNVMHSAFALMFTFFSVAGLYVLLNADFLAITQIMIYIGGILVLIIFGVMLTTRITGVDIKTGAIGKIGFKHPCSAESIVCSQTYPETVPLHIIMSVKHLPGTNFKIIAHRKISYK